MNKIIFFDNISFKLKLLHFLFKTYKLNGSNFCYQLYKNNCYLTGSFILSLLNYTNLSDVDVFSFNNDNNFEDYLLSNGFVVKDTQDEYFSYKYNLNVISVKNFFCKHSELPIQVIKCDITKTIENILDHFDLTICMNYFDGKSLICKYKNDIIEKKFDAYIKYPLHLKTDERIKKYQSRGYMCKHVHDPQKLIHDSDEKCVYNILSPINTKITREIFNPKNFTN